MLERIMYNTLYKYLPENNSLYCKQFGFQKGHSPEHAIVRVVEQIHQSFKKNKFTLLKKIECYGIAGNNLRWFENYVKDRKQFISFEHSSTIKATVTCGVPQRSILGPLLFR